MFLGNYRHALDSKGRVSVPKKFLEAFQDPGRARMFFATRGLEGCVFLFLGEAWEELVSQVRKTSLGSPEARSFGRQWFSFARELPLDGTGRILLPKEYRELTGITSEAVLVGVDSRIELWAPDKWEEEERRNHAGYEEFAGKILGGVPSPPLPVQTA